MKKYEINEKTLALAPRDNKTIVYEEDSTFLVDGTPNKIMEDSCAYYGSTLEGRQKGASKLLNISYKIPVIVEDVNNLVFFPTASPKGNKCMWLALNNILNYYKDEEEIVIVFKNKKEIRLKESYRIIDNQILKATRLGCVMQERIKRNTKKS